MGWIYTGQSQLARMTRLVGKVIDSASNLSPAINRKSMLMATNPNSLAGRDTVRNPSPTK